MRLHRLVLNINRRKDTFGGGSGMSAIGGRFNRSTQHSLS